MNVLHLNSGNETGGGMFHILSLLNQLKNDIDVTLGVFHDLEMAKRARNLGIKVKVFNQKSKFDFSILKEIREYINENNIDILHTHGARANFMSLFFKSKIDCRWYITVHSDPLDDFLNQGIIGKIYTKLNIKAIKTADRILAISERFKQDLVELGVNQQKITTILNGIDFQISSNEVYKREDFGFAEDDFIIMMIARLEYVKSHETALLAMKRLVKKSQNIKLCLIGDGTRREELQQKVKELEISDNVIFLGQRNDIPELLNLCDISILTSKSESFPLVLLESARAKKPVITTDVGGVRALIPDESYSFIIDVGDDSNLAEKIFSMFKMKENGKIKEMGEKLYLHASSHFSDVAFAKSVLAKYKND